MSSARRILLVAILWLAGLGAAAQFAKIAVILPELAAIYPAAGAGLGFLVSLIGVLGIAFGLVAGLLAARLGPRRLLVGGLALGAAVSAAQAGLPPIPAMLASRVLEGASHLAVVVAAPTLIAAIATPAARPFAMTLWGTFFGVAFAVVAWLGLPLVAWSGVPALFLAHAAWMALAAGTLAALLPDEAREARPMPQAGEILRRHATAYRDAAISAPAIGWLFYTMAFVSLLAILPGLVSPGERAFVAGAMPLASIAASMTLGVALLRFVSAVAVTAIGFAASAALALALLVDPGSPTLCIALFAALGLVQGATFAAVPELVADPADRALANGAMAQTGNLGNAIGTPLLLAVMTGAGVGPMLVLAAGLQAAGLAAHLVLARRRAAA